MAGILEALIAAAPYLLTSAAVSAIGYGIQAALPPDPRKPMLDGDDR